MIGFPKRPITLKSFSAAINDHDTPLLRTIVLSGGIVYQINLSKKLATKPLTKDRALGVRHEFPVRVKHTLNAFDLQQALVQMNWS